MLYADLIIEELKKGPKTRTQILKSLMHGKNRDLIRSRYYDEAIRADLSPPITITEEEYIERRWSKVSGKICICLKELQVRGYSQFRIKKVGELFFIL